MTTCAAASADIKPRPVGLLAQPRSRVEEVLRCQYLVNSRWGSDEEYWRCEGWRKEQKLLDALSEEAWRTRKRAALFCLPRAYREARLFFTPWGEANSWPEAYTEREGRSRRFLDAVRWLEEWIRSNDPGEEREPPDHPAGLPPSWLDVPWEEFTIRDARPREPAEVFPGKLRPAMGFLEPFGGLPALPTRTRRRLIELAFERHDGYALAEVYMRAEFVPEPELRALAKQLLDRLYDERKFPRGRVWADWVDESTGEPRPRPAPDDSTAASAVAADSAPDEPDPTSGPAATSPPGSRRGKRPAGFLAEPTSRDEQVLRCQFLAGKLNEREAAACMDLEKEERELDPLAALAADFRRRELLECLPEELQAPRLYKPFARDAFDKAVKDARRGRGNPLFRFALWYDDWYRASDDRRPRWDRREALWGLFPAWRKLAGEAAGEAPTPMTAKELARMHGPLAPVGGIPAIPTDTRRRMIELAFELGNETVLVEVFMRPELTAEPKLRELAAKLRGQLVAKRAPKPAPDGRAPGREP